MNNKLSLLVNFIGAGNLSGSIRNIIGLGGKGSKSLRAMAGESRKLTGELKSVQREIAKGAGNITQLVDRERALERQLTQTNSQLERQKRLAAIDANTSAMKRRGEDLKSSGRDSIVGAAVNAIPLIAAAKQAMTFEAAMADVRKVVDFPTPKAFAQMSSDVLALSTRIPMAAEGIAAIVAAAGRANIPRKQLLAFAEDAAKMGVAFDMTGDEAGGMMAKWRTAFSMGQGDVVRLSNQINALTNTYGGHAVAVAGIVTRIGSLGEVSGVAAAQVGAMAQLLNSVGVEEDVAATGIKNMMLALTKGTAATKSQEKVFKALGLSSTGMAERMQKDAGGAITDVLARLNRLPKAAQAGMLTDLFGSESVGAIAPMLMNLKKLEANFALVGNKAAYAGSMNKEYLAAIATTDGATGLAMNSLKALNIEIGTTMLPTITSAAENIRSIALAMRDWSQAHPQLASNIVTVLSSLIAFRMGLGVLKFAFGGILGPLGTTIAFFKKNADGVSKFGRIVTGTANVLKKAVPVFSMLRTAAVFMAKGVVRAGLMMMANPMVLAITAIVLAIGGAAYLIYTHWDRIKAAFWGGVAAVKGLLTGFPAWMKNIGSMMMSGLLSAINPLALGARLIAMAKNGITAFKNYLGIKSPSRVFMALGSHVAGGLERGIDGNRSGPARAAGRMAAGVLAAGSLAMAPAAAAGRGDGSAFRMAAGSQATAPDTGGRRGDDSAFRMAAGSMVPPAARTTGADRAGGDTYQITLQINQLPGEDAEALARRVMEKIEQLKARKARSSYQDDR